MKHAAYRAALAQPRQLHEDWDEAQARAWSDCLAILERSAA